MPPRLKQKLYNPIYIFQLFRPNGEKRSLENVEDEMSSIKKSKMESILDDIKYTLIALYNFK